MSLDLKKLYYYIIALIAFFILLWGIIDFVSASANLIASRYLAPQLTGKMTEPGMEEYYQQRVSQDRIFDSLARIVVSGGIFIYAKAKLSKLERS